MGIGDGFDPVTWCQFLAKRIQHKHISRKYDNMVPCSLLQSSTICSLSVSSVCVGFAEKGEADSHTVSRFPAIERMLAVSTF